MQHIAQDKYILGFKCSADIAFGNRHTALNSPEAFPIATLQMALDSGSLACWSPLEGTWLGMQPAHARHQLGRHQAAYSAKLVEIQGCSQVRCLEAVPELPFCACTSQPSCAPSPPLCDKLTLSFRVPRAART